MKLFEKKSIGGVKYLIIFGKKIAYGEETSHREIQEGIAAIHRDIFDKILPHIEKHIEKQLDWRADWVVARILEAKTHADIYQCAAIEHQKVFPKYRNCNAGRDLVVLASGPTLDYYNLHQKALYLGLNKSFYANKAELDYLFVQDYIPSAQNDMDAYKGNNCRKFYGVHYIVPPIAQRHADRANAERYYFIDCDDTTSWRFPPDISMLPFATYSTVVHPAVEFALYTGVRRIFLVGCDTSQGGYSKILGYVDSGKNFLPIDNVMTGWRRLKEFAAYFYPGTEIISVNPVGLKGMFKDVYTEEFIRAHPEVRDAERLVE